jgi:hypothetical protein
MNTSASLQAGCTITGPALSEPVEVHAVTPMGSSVRIMGLGRRSGTAYNTILSADQVAALEILTDRVPFDGDARRFRLGVEAHRLGLAHEYDPFFALSIARVDPRPHQLEAVYDQLDQNSLSLGAPEIPSGDELAAEFERFLRDQDE